MSLDEFTTNTNRLVRASARPESGTVSAPNHRTIDDGIAIIGMGCRFPGAHGPDAFWRLLCDEVDPITEVPTDRWSSRAYFAPAPPKPGKTYSCWGGFLDGIDLFDAGFFGISPREASAIDPQQRLLLEVAAEALDDAGLTQEWLAGRAVSVFVGASSSDYLQLQSHGQNYRSINAYTNSGGALSIVANRLSYLLDLRGPSLTVDTACSSSLVAFHYACESLRRGEAEAAIVGGVNILLWQSAFIGFSQAHMLSPEGRCRSFDASGNGYVRAEGAGAVVLKPLRAALQSGDTIQAVILASGVNQDGRTAGMSLPNENAQASLLQEVYAKARVDPQQVSYVEAHGTGTAAGDPIEARAIGRTLGLGRSDQDRLWISSVKSNIGHLEPASGIAGVIKTVLAMKHGVLPATLHFQTPNPAIDFESLRLRVVAQNEAWRPINGSPRIAGVNSFGFGGTNAHVVLSESPVVSTGRGEVGVIRLEESEKQSFDDAASFRSSHVVEAQTRLLPLSAKNETGLRELANVWRDWLTGINSLDRSEFDDITFTAAARRAHHDYRLAVASSSIEQASGLLEAWLKGEKRREVSSGHVGSSGRSKTVFVFNGMGSQWQGMGEELLRTEPIFRSVVQQLDAVFTQLAGWSVIDRLKDDEFRSRINEAEVTQPCIFAVQVGLAAIWRNWGIAPDFVVGHSVGEVAAAHVAGVLSMEDAVRVIYHRSRLQHSLRGQGRMLAVGLPQEMAEPLLARYGGSVSIAAVNSPSSVTLSGDAQSLEDIRQEMEAGQTFCRFLQVDVPYHCDRMEAIRDELHESLANLGSCTPTISYFSTVTGGALNDPQLDAEYWWRNVRQPVLFNCAMEALLAAGADTFVEIGAHPVLMNSMAECAGSATKITVLPSLRRGEPQLAVLLATLGRLYTMGRHVDWSRVYADQGRVVRLPPYPWQRESFWCEDAAQRRARLEIGGEASELLGPTTYSLLGQKVQSAHQEHAWHVAISIDSDHLWLSDHRVQGVAVFPAAGFIEQALSAGRHIHPNQPLCLESVEVSKALVLLPERQTTVETVVDAKSGDFHIDSHDTQETWSRHAWGKVRVDFSTWDDQVEELPELESRCITAQDVPKLYAWFASVGLDYGPSFHGIESVRTAPGIAVGRLHLPNTLVAEADRFTFCPSLLDACMQLMLAAASGLQIEEEDNVGPQLYLPAKIGRLRVQDPDALADASRTGLTVSCRIVEKTVSRVQAEAVIYNRSGHAMILLEGFEAHAFPISRQEAFQLEDCLFDHHWELRPRPSESFTDGMPSPKLLSAHLQTQINPLQENFGRRPFQQEQQSAMESQALSFAVSASVELGCEWSVGEKFTIDELSKRLGIVPNRESLFHNMLQRLALGGCVRIVEESVEILSSLPLVDSSRLWQENYRRYPNEHAEQLLAWRVGDNLASILSGQYDLQDAIFPGGTTGLLEQAEEDGPSFRIQNRLLQEAFFELVRLLPAERPLRVLEVGGGTGAVGAFVLPVLPPERTEYVFADAPTPALAATRQKLREFPFVRFIELDAKDGLLSQSATLFDVIICYNVTLAGEFTSLFAPDGMLIVCDGPATRGRSWERDGSGWYALRVSERCSDLRTSLESFMYRDITEISDSRANRFSSSAVWLARAPHKTEQSETQPAMVSSTSSPSGFGVWWLLGGENDVSESLAIRLSKAGGRPIRIANSAQFRQVDRDQYELPLGDANAIQVLCDVAQANDAIPQSIILVGSLSDPAGDDVTVDILRRCQSRGLNMALALIQAVAQSKWTHAPRLWLVTRNVHTAGLPANSRICLASAPLWGLARVLGNEMPHLRCTAIDLNGLEDEAENSSLFREIAADEDDREIVLRGSKRYVARLVRGALPSDSSISNRQFRVAVGTRGNLDSVVLLPTQRTEPTAGQVEIEVVASAVNFKDVAKALHLLSDETLAGTWSGDTLGLECAGRIVAIGSGVAGLKIGDRVVALAADCFRPYVVTQAEFVAPVPEHIALDEAAGIPVVFLTAWYALHNLARIQAGERVLIHAAAGGVGLAAIQIARAAGAEVLVTAGSPLKREYLRALGIAQVFDSRSLSFVDDVRQVTNGQGVDVLLNSLAGAAVPASLSLLRAGGRFVEIGKRDIQENAGLGLRPFHNNLSFFALDLDRLLAQRPEMARSLLDTVLNQFAIGKLTPLPSHAFPVSRTADALRHIAKARQIGKVVLDMRDPVATRLVHSMPSNKELRFAGDGTYLLSGGTSGFGMATAKWLITHGARHLVLLSRRGATSFEAQQDILELENAGARVLVLSVDVADEQQLRTALETVRRTMPPLKGVFHAAMVLDDVIALQLTPERMEKVLAPKAWGGWNLHALTREDPLDYFVLFSSATTIFGNPSQANYVAACTFLDQFAQYRRAIGLPALSVAWGAIADVGYLSRNQDVLKHIEERLGFRPIPSAQMLRFLEQLITTDRSLAALVAVNWSRFSPSKFPIAATPRMLGLIDKLGSTSADTISVSGRFRERLLAAIPEERRGLMREFLKKSLAGVLGTSPESLEVDRSLLAMGLDSLMAVELQMALHRELECELSPMQLLRGPSIEELTDELMAEFSE